MIAQDRHTPPSYSMKQPSLSLTGGHNVPVGHFLKEAVQMLTQVSYTVNTHNNHLMSDTATASTSVSANHNTEETTDTQQQQDLVSTTPTTDTTVAGSVTWKLNLSPTLMTLDTNIQTVAGLVQVLEQLFANVDPQPTFTHSSSSSSSSSSYSSSNPPPPPPPSLSLSPSSSSSSSSTYASSTVVLSDRYQMQGIIHAIGEALRLSQLLVVPQNDVFHAVNTIQLMKQCVQVFIMCDGAFFMDVPDLLSKTDLVLSSPNTTLFIDRQQHGGGDHPLETLLLLCICSMMIRHVMVHRRGPTAMAAGLAHAYYSQAWTRLQDLFDVPHITVLRSMFILSVFPHSHLDLFSPSRIGSPLLTSATRMAVAMNLDQLDNSSNNNNTSPSDHGGSEEKERRRRLAWMLLCADHFADVNRTGQAGHIDATHWHVDFPTPMTTDNNNTRRVELFSHYCRIVMIRKMQLFRSAYMVVTQSTKALAANMDQKLFDTYTTTPDHLTLGLDLDTDAHLTRHWKKDDVESLLIETLHCNTRIMALVPFLPRRYLATFEQGCVSREAIIKDIYQHTKQQALLAKLSITPMPPATPFHHVNTPPPPPNNNSKKMKDTTTSTNLEMHTVVGCLTAANHLSFLLEVLGLVDPMYCHHQPTQPMLLLVHVYEMIQTNCQHAGVATVCRLNLIRALRLIQQARRVDPDLALVYLERMVASYIGSLSADDPSSSSLERTTANLLAGLRQASLISDHDTTTTTVSATTPLSSSSSSLVSRPPTSGVESSRNIKLESV